MTNVLRIVLMKHEEKLACIITAYYDFYLEEDTFIASLAHENFEFMHYIWAFGKNYLGDGKRVQENMIQYEGLFEMIKKYFGDDKEDMMAKIRVVLDWRVVSEDNILIALLVHNLDAVAMDYMGYYSHFLNNHLFVHCMTRGNNIFLQKALLLSAFDKLIFRDDTVIEHILTILKEGYRTNFLMNILTLIDISVWKNKPLKDLLEIFNDYVEEYYDKNLLLLSPNPLMSIALAAEILFKIGDSRRKFSNQCNNIRH